MTFEAMHEKFPVAGLKMYIEKTIEKLSMKKTRYTAVFILVIMISTRRLNLT